MPPRPFSPRHTAQTSRRHNTNNNPSPMALRYTCRRCLATLRSELKQRPSSFSSPLSSNTRRGHSTITSQRYNSTVQFRDHVSTDELVLPGKKPSFQVDLSGEEDLSRVILEQDNLFHPFSRSPIPAMRQRASFIKAQAYCPHPAHTRNRVAASPADPESRKPISGGLPPAHVSFECPDCGIPVSCSEEHWAEDYEEHLQICDILRQINEDDHDLRSGRYMSEFEFPDRHVEEAVINLTNWDTLLYTRGFNAINEERKLRQATRLLTYPVTIGSVLHELSPYNIRKDGQLTVEGLKSFSALRYTLHPPLSGGGQGIKGLRPAPPPVRIFVIGARAESSLPREVWLQLAYMFQRVQFHLILIGPESMLNRDSEYPLPDRTSNNPFGAIIEDRIDHSLKVSTYVDYFHTLHEARHFVPYDPYFDCFVLFHPGLGHPSSSHEWASTLPQLLETKCPVIVTGYTEWDMWRDIEWVQKQVGGEMDMLLEPGENRFRSLRWDLNDLDPQDISAGNWGTWAFRGKRYEAQKSGSE